MGIITTALRNKKIQSDSQFEMKNKCWSSGVEENMFHYILCVFHQL